jgi:hypothetical protein
VSFRVDKAGVSRFLHPGIERHDAEDTDPGHDPADRARRWSNAAAAQFVQALPICR